MSLFYVDYFLTSLNDLICHLLIFESKIGVDRITIWWTCDVLFHLILHLCVTLKPGSVFILKTNEPQTA